MSRPYAQVPGDHVADADLTVAAKMARGVVSGVRHGLRAEPARHVERPRHARPRGPLAGPDVPRYVALSVAVTRDLVFDVGMHDARDTAYYLRTGHRVVAVDANPELVRRAQQRFASEIAHGRLAVVWLGIGAEEGEASFWVCEDHSEWSSFDRSVASRNGSRHHEVRVPVSSLDRILEQYGVPRYCKIDIEGHDHLCVEAITRESRPDFLSVELSRAPLLEQLSALDYDRFKVVHQISFCPVSRRLQRVKERLGDQRVALVLERTHGLLRGSLFERSWYFRIGSSGPLPDRTPGRWHSLAEVEATVAELRRARARAAIGRGEWFDIHATTTEQVMQI